VRGKIECSVQKLMHLKGVAAVAQIQILCDFNCCSHACDRDDSMCLCVRWCASVLLSELRISIPTRFRSYTICRAEMKYSQNTHIKHTIARNKKNLHINKRAKKKANQNLIHGESKTQIEIQKAPT